MINKFSTKRFFKQFPDNDACLKEIISRKYPKGIVCIKCKRITKHYKLLLRPTYSCKFCRTQVNPLVGTIFEKSSTPLEKWFYAIYLLTQTRSQIKIKSLQEELGVTYKTAWRIYKQIYKLMVLKNNNLLNDTQVSRWVIFKTIELKVVRKS